MSSSSSFKVEDSFVFPFCRCGEVASLKHSWTVGNPGRRFFGCRRYGVREDACRFFQWIDPPFPEHASHVVNGLLKRVKEEERKRQEVENERDKAKRAANLYFFLLCLVVFIVGVIVVA